MTATESRTTIESGNDWQRLFTPVPLGLTAGFLIAVACNFVQVEHLLSLPAHPLLLHVPVVLVPLFALVAIWLAVQPSAIERFGLPISIVGDLVLIATVLTIGAGKAFEHMRHDEMIARYGSKAQFPPSVRAHLEAIDAHGEMGDLVRASFAILVLLVVGQYIVSRVRPQQLPLALLRNPAVVAVLRVLTVVFAVLACIAIYRVGHSGAELSFKDPFWPSA